MHRSFFNPLWTLLTRWTHKRVPFISGMLLLAVTLLAGCAVKPGIIFPPMANAPRWPAPPDVARIIYVGKLETSADLKPGMNGLEAFGQAVFGKEDAHSMLTPFALCVDPAGPDGGRLFVADSNAQSVHVFDLHTRKYSQWMPGKKQPPLNQPVGIAWDAAAPEGGRLLVADSMAGAIVVFNAQGQYRGRLGVGALVRPCGVAVEPATRRIVVADSKAHQIVILEPDGKFYRRIGTRGTRPGDFNFPTAVTFDSHGLLYVGDALNFRIQVFDQQYNPIRVVGQKGDLPGYFAQPKGLALDPEDHLYVLDSQFENIQLFDDQGRVLMDLGEEGHGPGQFWLPTGICISPVVGGLPGEARIWVADSYNRRIQVFEYMPSRAETQP